MHLQVWTVEETECLDPTLRFLDTRGLWLRMADTPWKQVPGLPWLPVILLFSYLVPPDILSWLAARVPMVAPLFMMMTLTTFIVRVAIRLWNASLLKAYSCHC